MSEKTSSRFLFSVVAFVIVVGGLIWLATKLDSSVMNGSGAGSEPMTAAAIAARVMPVGELNTGSAITAAAPAPVATAPAAAPAAASVVRTGSQVFHSVCFACHATGAAGAPKVGDKAAWKPRIAKGINTLLNHAIHGFQSNGLTMPPRGTCGNCSDQELKNAIEYMISKSK